MVTSPTPDDIGQVLRRLDDDLACLDCGQLNGVFGQLVRERLAQFE